MTQFTHEHAVIMLLGIGTLLLLARLFGELARMLRQPTVLGEILAGIVLGPTLLGRFAPGAFAELFPPGGPNALVLNALAMLAVTLFLFVAGMEVDLSTVLRQGRTAAVISVVGILAPFALGFGSASLAPHLLGCEPGVSPTLYALFFATALSISALPVIAKTLMDLDIYRSDFGMLIIAAAIVNDLAGWIIFATLLGMMGAAQQNHTIGMTIACTIGFSVGMLTVGRLLLHRMLPWLQAYLSWPGGVLGVTLALALFCAAFTEWVGVHAIFGAFIFGVALGDSSHLRERTRTVIDRFVSFFFAPLFFGWIGLQIDFFANFDISLTLLVTLIACAGKILGCAWAGRLTRMERNEAWALGFALNARGMMEIILGHLALQTGLIGERMFIALVVMAIVTSMMSGPAIQRLLRSDKPRRFLDFLGTRNFILRLQASDARGAIGELTRQLAHSEGLNAGQIELAVLDREEIMATGISGGLAVPHTRLPGIRGPLIAVGLSEAGIDFDAPDGEPARLVFLIVTPEGDDSAQLQLLADIARAFRDETIRQRLPGINSFTEFLALLKSEHQPAH